MEEQQEKLRAQIEELEAISVNRYWLQLIDEFEVDLAKYTEVKSTKYAFYDEDENITLKEYNMP